MRPARHEPGIHDKSACVKVLAAALKAIAQQRLIPLFAFLPAH